MGLNNALVGVCVTIMLNLSFCRPLMFKKNEKLVFLHLSLF
jgi:hypothetical protein